MFSFANVSANSGGGTALSGMLVVFAGLVLIAVVIHLFNLALRERRQGTEDADKDREAHAGGETAPEPADSHGNGEPIPEDDLIAIAALIELYRRVHFDPLQSQITFVRGRDAANAWQLGYKFGQRPRF